MSIQADDVVLRMRGISKRYGPVAALRPFDAEEEVRRIQAARAVKALGVATAAWAARYIYIPAHFFNIPQMPIPTFL